jgi:hypothetical protein
MMKVNDLNSTSKPPPQYSFNDILIRHIKKLLDAMNSSIKPQHAVYTSVKNILFGAMDPSTILQRYNSGLNSDHRVYLILEQLFSYYFFKNNYLENTHELIQNRNVTFELLFRIFHKFRSHYLQLKYPDLNIPSVDWYVEKWKFTIDLTMINEYPMTECMMTYFKYHQNGDNQSEKFYFPSIPTDSLDEMNIDKLKKYYLESIPYHTSVDFSSVYKLVTIRNQIVNLCVNYIKAVEPSFTDPFIQKLIQQNHDVRELIVRYNAKIKQLTLTEPKYIVPSDKLSFENSVIMMATELMKYYLHLCDNLPLINEIHELNLKIFDIYLPYEQDQLNYLKGQYERILSLEWIHK